MYTSVLLFFHKGMSFGLFLSAICTSESAALQAAVAAFYPTILLSGRLSLQINAAYNYFSLTIPKLLSCCQRCCSYIHAYLCSL